MSITHKSPNCGDIELLMQPREPQYILDLVPENGTLVEWGCGGSTVYFLDNLKEGQTLVSIEHNEQWYNKILDLVKNHPNVDKHVFLYIPPEIPNPYYARPEEEHPCGLRDYICPDVDIIEQGDVFLVDGIARGATAAFLAVRAKKEAQVIIHDYLGRENWYDWAVQCFDYSVQPEGTVLCHMAYTEIDNGEQSEIQPENPTTSA